MKSKTIIYINAFRIIWALDFVYYIVYNTYFGWNKHPINDTEKLCYDVFKFFLGFVSGSSFHWKLTPISPEKPFNPPKTDFE